MAGRSIFIASSSEAKGVATEIAQELARAHYTPRRWWKEFPAGSITIERLREIAGTVDGAVIVSSGDDKVWYRTGATAAPRDNVVFEYGIMVSALGLKRTLLLHDGQARLPSDWAGVTCGDLQADADTVAEKVVAHFDLVFREAELPLRIEALSIVADPEVVAKQLQEKPPAEWLLRSFYLGLEGARAWLAIADDPSYKRDSEKALLRKAVLEILRSVDVRTFVSLGPGDGLLDRDIASTLRRDEPWLQYVPVDISDGLLERAYGIVSQQVQVPFGILGDFEDRLNFVHHSVRERSPSPILYALLGNSFGNLDRYEKLFANSMRSILKDQDLLLLHVSLVKEDLASRGVAPSIASLGSGSKYFFASGIARKYGLKLDHTVENIDSILDAGVDAAASDVPGTESVTLFMRETGDIIAYARRYDFGLLASWLQEEVGLRIVDSCRLASSRAYDSGVFLVGNPSGGH